MSLLPLRKPLMPTDPTPVRSRYFQPSISQYTSRQYIPILPNTSPVFDRIFMIPTPVPSTQKFPTPFEVLSLENPSPMEICDLYSNYRKNTKK